MFFNRVTIRELAKLIGNLVCSFPAKAFGLLHYRHLQKIKNVGLSNNI